MIDTQATDEDTIQHNAWAVRQAIQAKRNEIERKHAHEMKKIWFFALGNIIGLGMVALAIILVMGGAP